MSKDEANARTAVIDRAAKPDPVAEADTKPEPAATAPPDGQVGAGLVRTVYVCSPYRPMSKDPECRKDELAANVERARHACRILTFLGYLPLAPHLYFTQFLKDEDEKERRDGMELGLRWLEQSDEVWMFGKTISEGMAKEIARAKELGKPVRCLPEPSRVVELLLKGAAGQLEQETQAQTHKEEPDE